MRRAAVRRVEMSLRIRSSSDRDFSSNVRAVGLFGLLAVGDADADDTGAASARRTTFNKNLA